MNDKIISDRHYCINSARTKEIVMHYILHYISHFHTRKMVQVGKDQEKEQSEKDFNSKNRGGKKPIVSRMSSYFPIGGHSVTLTLLKI